MSFSKVVCLSETRICRNLRNVYIDSGIKFNVVKHIIAFCTAYPRTSLSWNCCLLQLVCLERNMCKVDFSFCATDVSVAWSSWNPACLYGCSSVVSIHWQLHDTARCSLVFVNDTSLAKVVCLSETCKKAHVDGACWLSNIFFFNGVKFIIESCTAYERTRISWNPRNVYID